MFFFFTLTIAFASYVEAHGRYCLPIIASLINYIFLNKWKKLCNFEHNLVFLPWQMLSHPETSSPMEKKLHHNTHVVINGADTWNLEGFVFKMKENCSQCYCFYLSVNVRNSSVSTFICICF